MYHKKKIRRIFMKQSILSGQTSLGIEFGSTRIKAVLLGEQQQVLATGSHEWENQLVNGIWTYSLDSIWSGLQDCYAQLKKDVHTTYGVTLTSVRSIGISGMMHGYMPFDKDGKLLTPFRTWRNAMTQQAEKELTEAFQFNIPQRWSIAHLYQAILNKEDHVTDIHYFTTLAGYIHWQLTGEKIVGIGEASGIFPIHSDTKQYDPTMIKRFEELVAPYSFNWTLSSILPHILVAGEKAGTLTEKGATLLDPTGDLKSGILFCPPEGDAGTGMVATNSIAKRTGNISAGTSVFAMIVLEKALQHLHHEIDIVTTPVGDAVAMVHANNCTTDINAWVKLFHEFSVLSGQTLSLKDTYALLFHEALNGDDDFGSLLSYGYYSGENITQMSQGRPLLVRTPNSSFTIANLMKTHITSAFATLAIGMDILKEEQVAIDCILGHGGMFKTESVAQSILANTIDTPISVMETAGEGGAYGMALLAQYALHSSTQTLEEFLHHVFQSAQKRTIQPEPQKVAAARAFIQRYKDGLAVEQQAVSVL